MALPIYDIESDIIARLHEIGQVHAQDMRDDGVHIHGSFPAAQVAVFAPFILPGSPSGGSPAAT